MNEIEDPYVQYFLSNRDSPARQKIKLAEFRAKYPEGLIFSVEGVDDKQVYFHWIRSIAPDLQYEMHICGTKDDALKLLDALRRDQTDLAKDVYFLLDNDFDGLKGREPGPEVFLTPAYSIENYLVCINVLDDVLRVELHCHGEPQCRANVREAFSKIYTQFLEVTKSLNWRIYLARRAKIRQVGALPSKLSEIAVVSLLEVAASDTAAGDAVVLEREPSAVEIEHHKPDFDSLIPQMNYRGKFAFQFFQRWLRLLASDRCSEQSRLFGKTISALSPTNNFTLDMMASRSRPPRELNDFLQHFVAEGSNSNTLG